MAEAAFIIFMLVFGLVAMILLISRARMAELKLKNQLDGASQAKAVEQILADTQAEVMRLRERVAVLEKLATDEDRKLADEIEKLRRRDNQGPEARS